MISLTYRKYFMHKFKNEPGLSIHCDLETLGLEQLCSGLTALEELKIELLKVIEKKSNEKNRT